MKPILTFLISILLFLGTYNNAEAQWDTLTHDGLERFFLTHVPPAYDGKKELPLIIAMHGGLGSATNIEDQSQLSVAADKSDYIVVYPEGVKSKLGIRTWNAGVCCGYASEQNIDDVGFINKMLDVIIKNYAIDTNRIYATGISNGGFMSYRLACELSDRIAAIAPVAASMTMDNCVPSRQLPVMHFHSILDSNILHSGGIGDGLSKHYNPPVDSVLNVFASNNNCTVLNDTIKDDSKYMHIKWSSCKCNSNVEYFLTTDGGHSWHGGKKTVIGDRVSRYVSATDTMIRFFNQHSLKCNPNSVHDLKYSNSLKIYPSPTEGSFTISNPKAGLKSYTIVDQVGKTIIQAQTLRKNYTFDLQNFSSGTYYLKTNDGQVQKLMLLK